MLNYTDQSLLDYFQPLAGEVLSATTGPASTPAQLKAEAVASAAIWAKEYTTAYDLTRLPQLDAKALAAQEKSFEKAKITARQNRDSGTEDFFKILYTNVKGQKKSFVFALLPAIDLSSRGVGNSNVPDLKAGVVIRTSMRQKNIPIPGGTPIIQTIGVDSTIMQVVGAFIGSERITNPADSSRGDLSTIYTGLQNLSTAESSETKARAFMSEVVHSGRPVEFHAKSVSRTSDNPKAKAEGMELKYKGVIVNFKFYAARRNRSYYAIDLILSEYDVNKA
jgi:hypothetical protein